VTPLIPIASCLLSSGFIALLLRSGGGRLAIDQPNERSLHVRPIPRVGGLGILVGALPAWWFSGADAALWLPALLLGGLSFLDDRAGLPIAARFGAHAVAAVALLLVAFPAIPWIVVPVAVLALMWFTNLYNFMDGSDGLAGGMAVAGFGAYAVAAWQSDDAALAIAAAGTAAAALGFLAFNFHPARVFMGDSGSIPLGFLAGAMGLAGWRDGLWPLWFPILAFAPFVVDASVTLARRMLRGERFWQAHRTHYYQRLVQLGWGHRRTAFAEYGLMLLCAAVALAVRTAGVGTQMAALAGCAVVLAMAGISVDAAWRRHGRGAPS
jgi:UDP-N-acetylmuramyl pentapeptide phosphotransferase/UDP-N-acetylglucosamine-1-phosphate transferase